PIEDWDAQGMLKAHEQTQQDFKGAKKENLANFKQYNVEAIREERVAYLPPADGRQVRHPLLSDRFDVVLLEVGQVLLLGSLEVLLGLLVGLEHPLGIPVLDR